MPDSRHVPRATYRVQLTREFGFAAARAIVPYLRDLGVSDLYVSPILQARSGSSHGYGVVDPTRISEDLGGEDDFLALAAALREQGMGLLVDIVPNHMAAGSENPSWNDVLQHGPASLYASYFDIDWGAESSAGPPKQVLLPVLGRPFGEALEAGELRLAIDEAGLAVRYFDIRFPLDPATYPIVLREVAVAEPIVLAAAALPSRDTSDDGERARRARETQKLHDQLWSLYQRDTAARLAIDDALAAANGRPGEPATFNRLQSLLDAQAYRLAYWRTGLESLNYRRFFDISELAGVRLEDGKVFDATHQIIGQLVAQGNLTGLRVDHIDGPRDPARYLHDLRRLCANAGRATYIVVEKILAIGEELPETWPVDGATGYEFLNWLNALFVDWTGVDRLRTSYAASTASGKRLADVTYKSKKHVLIHLFPAELRSLTRRFANLARKDRYARDLPIEALRAALLEVTACLPVYRTYADESGMDASDRDRIERACRLAAKRAPQLDRTALDFVRRTLTLTTPAGEEDITTAQTDATLRWQQLTGPAMAKGFEDTACYVYNPLISLNEVGSDTEGRSFDVGRFHEAVARRHAAHPHSLSATSTHDTKRSEDVRARLNAISEVPVQWDRCLRRWRTWNAGHKANVDGEPAPSVNDEIYLYQILLGAWPLHDGELSSFADRIEQHVIKAAREAKTHTSWLRPNVPYEQAYVRFARLLIERPDARFRDDFAGFQPPLAYAGMLNSLAQVVLKVAAPGVPDIYQGTELWDFSLTDPDNRRSVDFVRRRALLDELGARGNEDDLLAELLAGWPDGRIKLLVTWRALRPRAEHAAVFREGRYVALSPAGRHADHLVAFARAHDEGWALAIVPRLVMRWARVGKPPMGRRVWADSVIRLPADAPTRWANALTAETVMATQRGPELAIDAADALRRLPVALLIA